MEKEEDNKGTNPFLWGLHPSGLITAQSLLPKLITLGEDISENEWRNEYSPHCILSLPSPKAHALLSFQIHPALL